MRNCSHKNIEIVKAENEESLRQCLAIRNDVFTVEKGVPKSIEIDGFDILGGQCEHFLIKCDGDDAGTVRCVRESDFTIRIQRFCLYKRFRSSGVGREALEYLERYYSKSGVAKIVLDAKFEVCGFYEKCGYEKVSDVFIEAGIEHIKMRKGLL